MRHRGRDRDVKLCFIAAVGIHAAFSNPNAIVASVRRHSKAESGEFGRAFESDVKKKVTVINGHLLHDFEDLIEILNQSGSALVLIIYLNIAPLDADIDGVLTVVVTDSVSETTAGHFFATTGWNADLNAYGLRLTTAIIRARILHDNDLRCGARRHLIHIRVLNMREKCPPVSYGIYEHHSTTHFHICIPVRHSRNLHVRNRRQFLCLSNSGEQHETH